jgi:hypothetical protein
MYPTGNESVRRRVIAALLDMTAEKPDLSIWQWAAQNVDFSRASNYDTPIKGPYDPDWMPMWKEPAEAITDPDIREIIVLKSSRAGGSENLLLNAIRYAIAEKPQPTLYVTGDQSSAERMMMNRIKRSMPCATACKREYKKARVTEHEIQFPAMDFRVTWPKSKQAFKQDGWSLILCDELSTWPEWSMDMARRRTAAYPFSHIVAISSPDPNQRRGSDDDPIFVEFRRGDQRHWEMPDPAADDGSAFTFEMGGPDSASGLKWDHEKAKREDGTYDYDVVEQTAHYVTPAGATITDQDRLATVATGKWVPRNPGQKTVRSYHINAMYIPLADCSFGKIAVAFLKAKSAGPIALRTFIYEYLAEEWRDETVTVYDDEIYQRCAKYNRGDSYLTDDSKAAAAIHGGGPAIPILTVDVQKNHVWWLLTEFYEGGNAAIKNYGAAVSWAEIKQLVIDNQVFRVLIDNSYEQRSAEVYEECYRIGMIPCLGRASIQQPFIKSPVDPFEGKRGQGKHAIPRVTWNPNMLKPIAHEMLRGESAYKLAIYAHPERELIRQLIAEEFSGGEWVCRRGYPQNHLWDCFVLAVLCARMEGIHRTE